MSDSDVPDVTSASAIIRKRGRPRKGDTFLVAPKPTEANHVVMQRYRDGGKEWVEVAARERGKALSCEEKVGFLRCVSALRRMVHDNKIMIKNALGQFQCPQPVVLAADMMSIGQCEAKAVHSAFQASKMLPSGSGRGLHERKLVIEEMFGASHLESWCRMIVLKCKATAKRPTYRDITIGLQELAASHAREELQALGYDVDDEFFETIGDTLSYQRVVRWCHRHRWLFSKITKRKGIVEDASEMQGLYADYCEKLFSFVDARHLILPPLRHIVVIYLDESYCNEKHAKEYAVCKLDDISTWSDVVKDGRRLCFCTAISEDGEIATLDTARPAECESSRWIFCPNKDQQKKKDYHSSFAAENWLPYFKERLLPACERVYPGATLVFVMDNASYHVSCTFQIDGETPGSPPIVVDKARSSKKVLCKCIQKYRGDLAAANMNMRKDQLQSMYAALKKDLGSDLERHLAEKNHVLILTPPRMSTWQPIELYWASCKNEVAKLFRKGRGLIETQEQLEASLTKWGTAEHCSKLIAHTTRLVRKWWDAAQQAEAAVERQAILNEQGELNASSDDDSRMSIAGDGNEGEHDDFDDEQ